MKYSNKYFILIVFSLFIYARTISAQTYVSGFILANTNWNLAGSPYIVTGNALLSHGYKLTIDPGVVIKFDQDKALQIDGELIAIGSPQQRIIFTSNLPNPATGDWAKIHFADTCVDAVLNSSGNYLSGSIMKYCDVEYGGGLGFGSIQIETANPFINNCNITNSGSSGIYSSNSIYRIDSSTIKNCNEFGLSYNSITLDDGDLIINSDSICFNAFGGIQLIGPLSQLHSTRIINNYISYNLKYGAIFFYGYSNIKIERNIFEGNTSNTYGIVSGNNSITDALIQCNTFKNNLTRFGVIYFPANFTSCTICNNIFDGNSNQAFPNTTSVINLDFSNSSDTSSIFNNIIINNTSSGNCINIRPHLINNVLLRVYNNEFMDNDVESVFYLDGYTTPTSNLDYLYLKHNNFSDPLSHYEFYNHVQYGSPNAYIDSNYWGSVNVQHIDSVIYDYFDFANQSVVYYLPPLQLPAEVIHDCINLNVGIDQVVNGDLDLILYPNPASLYFTATFDHNNSGNLKMYNILGELLLMQALESNSKSEVDLQKIKNGIYFVVVENSEKKIIRKLIVSKN